MRDFLNRLYFSIPGLNRFFEVGRKCFRPSPRFTRWLRYSGTVRVDIDERHHFLMRSRGEFIENNLFWHGFGKDWEAYSLKIWSQLCKKANSILDVGANTGIYGLVAKSMNPKAKVICFEPVLRTYEKLVENSKLNKFEIDCLPLALSNRDGSAVIYDPGGHVYAVTVDRNLASPRTTVKEERIQVCRLDSLSKDLELTNIDLIKIDVETHEPEVIEGIGEFWNSSRPIALVEILNTEIGERIEKMLSDYRYFLIDEQQGLIPVDHLSKGESRNACLVPSERLGELHRAASSIMS